MDGNIISNKFSHLPNLIFTCQCFVESFCTFLLASGLLMICVTCPCGKGILVSIKLLIFPRRNHIGVNRQRSRSLRCGPLLKLLLFFGQRSLVELFWDLFSLESFKDSLALLLRLFH